MGLWAPASSEIDNGETWPLTNFWILLLTLLEFFHKALTNASLSHYPITARALVSDLADPDYSLVTFTGCGAFLWITVPTFCHQLAPEGWGLLAALPVNWAVTFTHSVKEFLQRCYWSDSKKGPLSVPSSRQETWLIISLVVSFRSPRHLLFFNLIIPTLNCKILYIIMANKNEWINETNLQAC